MTTYRRNFVAGGSYFFTANLAERRFRLLADNIELLRAAFRYARRRHPFVVDAIVVLPDHLRTIWTLPGRRWRFRSPLAAYQGERIPRVAPNGGDFGQSHAQTRARDLAAPLLGTQVRDENDFARHLDYIHFNPVKHAMWSAWGPGRFCHSIAWCGSASTPRPGRAVPRISKAGSASGDGFRSAQPILRAGEPVD
jgi:putative transposase